MTLLGTRRAVPLAARRVSLHLALVRSLGAIVLFSTLAGATPTPLRRESDPRFTIDVPFQDKGGVQYFYALLPNESSPERNETFALFRPFDASNVWSRLDSPPSVVMSRLVYTVERDVSFFNEARARDVEYINAVAKEMDVVKREDGTFRVGKMPANTFRIDYFDADRLAKGALELPAVRRALELSGIETPTNVVFQENSEFSRVMGMRIADGSVTWTIHAAIGPGRTRVVVFTMSYLRTLPPFFLGGPGRVLRESTEGARVLIDNLRAYQPPKK
jgi:hypothetical protein